MVEPLEHDPMIHTGGLVWKRKVISEGSLRRMEACSKMISGSLEIVLEYSQSVLRAVGLRFESLKQSPQASAP